MLSFYLILNLIVIFIFTYFFCIFILFLLLYIGKELSLGDRFPLLKEVRPERKTYYIHKRYIQVKYMDIQIYHIYKILSTMNAV